MEDGHFSSVATCSIFNRRRQNRLWVADLTRLITGEGVLWLSTPAEPGLGLGLGLGLGNFRRWR
jgi:hypothetical protein